VNASTERSATAWPGLLQKLMAVVRTEFRGEVYVPNPDHPVLGRGTCPVTDCDRSPTEHGLCSSHGQRWADRGRPELAEFLTDPGPPVNGRRDLTGCTVPGCRYSSGGVGLCIRHRSTWTASGRPDPAIWAITAPAADPAERAICGLPFCTLWIESKRNLFCKTRETRWRMQGRPDVEEFISQCLLRGRARIDFRGLPPQLTLELQYAVQRRAEQATITLPPAVAAWTIRQAREARVTSLLERSAQQWADGAGPKTSSYPASLAFAREVVETLYEGTGWEVEFPRDIWRLDRLPGLTTNAGKPSSRARLRFDRISQPWLRTLVKRWSRLRLSSGLAVGTVVSDVKALTRFSTFLTEAVPEVDGLAALDRAVLERYLAWLATAGLGPGAKQDAVTGVGTLFQAARQYDWDPCLPTAAVFFAGDLPPRPSRVTRHLAEHVMAQVEAAANLDRWPNPAGRLVTLILIQCGLRTTDACTLSFDCLLHDGQDAPYLRYFKQQDAPRGRRPHRRRPRGRDPGQAAADRRPMAAAAPTPVSAAQGQCRRATPVELLQLPRDAPGRFEAHVRRRHTQIAARAARAGQPVPPARSASRITGTKPAEPIRFGSSKTAETLCDACTCRMPPRTVRIRP
jgi:hypothetical protein